MDYARLWFSFRGRLNRAKYWLVTLVNLSVLFVLFFIGFATGSWTAFTIAGITFIPVVVSGFAIAVRRLHDRDKSAWWLLLFYALPAVLHGVRDELVKIQETTAFYLAFACIVLSAIISIWALVELGFLRGTSGENRYGPDPLASM
jgi:uncharacterized membrane protein YhaH (DUF805 family)